MINKDAAGVPHGGCIVCGSKDEPVLTSGVRPSTNPHKFMGESVAVCSRPDCRVGVEFIRKDG